MCLQGDGSVEARDVLGEHFCADGFALGAGVCVGVPEGGGDEVCVVPGFDVHVVYESLAEDGAVYEDVDAEKGDGGGVICGVRHVDMDLECHGGGCGFDDGEVADGDVEGVEARFAVAGSMVVAFTTVDGCAEDVSNDGESGQTGSRTGLLTLNWYGALCWDAANRKLAHGRVYTNCNSSFHVQHDTLSPEDERLHHFAEQVVVCDLDRCLLDF